jgi:hypothetical protein
VKAGRIAGGAQALEVEHSPAIERAQDELATPGAVQGLDLARDVNRHARRDVRDRHSSNPSENSSA